jgi:DNA-binding response OmpR family regulator
MQIGVEMARAMENKRVFIVDDDEIIRAALQFMLHDEFEAHEIASATLALEKSKSQSPDLVIVGASLLKTQGLETLLQFRAATPAAKILVVVDAGDTGFGGECKAAGADGFIAKPLKVEFVRQKVDAMLGRGKGVVIPLNVLG